ncbi:circadian clock protein KaiC [Luteolibacter yonseiensis]|uniref:non-specific serine/threonine protein kinase n=1 Tax=Luteolibacter yonseiensis TaxID=1144680 RepID=A0A934VBM5_9BACT|nr:circadian clock protein KaiC [Luteolibacter yonseiensis]MBK1817433.1 circadian clock protein KaiC [Luteolibacter yonseiensis]
MSTTPSENPEKYRLIKAPTGITGFDEITLGGLPAGRPTLVCGSAGCGKSLFGAEFLVRGVREFGENGVLFTFEESANDIYTNVESLGFGLPELVAQEKVALDHITIDRQQIDENGEYDLEGLFVRLAYAIESVNAKRVVLDTIETLFAGFQNQAILRSELRRLFDWLKDRGMTTVITAERGDGALTRQGLEEYVSDCVVLLDHRVTGQISTRRLRVVKYRGSAHSTNEFPFLIDSEGMSVLPITSAGMDYDVSDKRLSSGVPALDEMLDGGYYEGSCILLTGTAGTGKSTLAAHLANKTCGTGQRCLYFSFEESPKQILRNMRTIGIDLQPSLEDGSLEICSSRPAAFGLEMHLVQMHKKIDTFKPNVVIVDPISNLHTAASGDESSQMLLRLIDILRSKRITTFLINLTRSGNLTETSGEALSSMVDTWLLLRDVETYGERNRVIYVLKSRGMPHSNQLREFIITRKGVDLIPAYLGSEGVLTGSARLAQEQRETAAAARMTDEEKMAALKLEQKRRALDAQIEVLRAEHLAAEEELSKISTNRSIREELASANERQMNQKRLRTNESR